MEPVQQSNYQTKQQKPPMEVIWRFQTGSKVQHHLILSAVLGNGRKWQTTTKSSKLKRAPEFKTMISKCQCWWYLVLMAGKNHYWSRNSKWCKRMHCWSILSARNFFSCNNMLSFVPFCQSLERIESAHQQGSDALELWQTKPMITDFVSKRHLLG